MLVCWIMHNLHDTHDKHWAICCSSCSWNAANNGPIVHPLSDTRRVRVAQSIKCLTTDWTTGWPRFDPWQKQRIFSLSSVSRQALRPTQSPVQWVLGGPFPRSKARSAHDADHSPHLVQRSRMSRAIYPLPLFACMAVVGQLYQVIHKHGEPQWNDTNR
jgi:hypothetical protein